MWNLRSDKEENWIQMYVYGSVFPSPLYSASCSYNYYIRKLLHKLFSHRNKKGCSLLDVQEFTVFKPLFWRTIKIFFSN